MKNHKTLMLPRLYKLCSTLSW